MANVRSGNVIFCDTASAAADTGINLKVTQVIFTSNVANDYFELSDTASSSTKVLIKHATAADTKIIEFKVPIVFSQGIYVKNLSASCYLMIVLA